jgi:ion transport protein
MSGNDSARAELANTGYEIFIAALSVLSLVNLVLVFALQDPATQTVVRTIDLLLSVVFLVDFLARLHRAPSRAGYFFRRFGWADLLASLPFPYAKVLRVFRLTRVVRLLRRYGTGNIGRSLIKDRAGSALLTLLLAGILVLEFGSLAVLHVEKGAPGANIATAADALWYVIVTIATVGYGDQYPVTVAGRWLGTLVILIGVAIFGTLTGYLANFFLSPQKKRSVAPAPTTLEEARLLLQQVQDLLAQQQAAVAELELRLGPAAGAVADSAGARPSPSAGTGGASAAGR